MIILVTQVKSRIQKYEILYLECEPDKLLQKPRVPLYVLILYSFKHKKLLITSLLISLSKVNSKCDKFASLLSAGDTPQGRAVFWCTTVSSHSSKLLRQRRFI